MKLCGTYGVMQTLWQVTFHSLAIALLRLRWSSCSAHPFFATKVDYATGTTTTRMRSHMKRLRRNIKSSRPARCHEFASLLSPGTRIERLPCCKRAEVVATLDGGASSLEFDRSYGFTHKNRGDEETSNTIPNFVKIGVTRSVRTAQRSRPLFLSTVSLHKRRGPQYVVRHFQGPSSRLYSVDLYVPRRCAK